jgi:hypothetical protein
MNELLSFEKEKCRDPRRFPMYFRLKLDICGIKLCKRDWVRFDFAEKEQLLAMPCETPVQIAAFRKKLLGLVQACGGHALEIEPALASDVARSPWTDKTAIPEAVRQQINFLAQGAVNFTRWAALSDLQRFALIKLTEPGKTRPELRQVLNDFRMLSHDDAPAS